MCTVSALCNFLAGLPAVETSVTFHHLSSQKNECHSKPMPLSAKALCKAPALCKLAPTCLSAPIAPHPHSTPTHSNHHLPSLLALFTMPSLLSQVSLISPVLPNLSPLGDQPGGQRGGAGVRVHPQHPRHAERPQPQREEVLLSSVRRGHEGGAGGPSQFVPFIIILAGGAPGGSP